MPSILHSIWVTQGWGLAHVQQPPSHHGGRLPRGAQRPLFKAGHQSGTHQKNGKVWVLRGGLFSFPRTSVGEITALEHKWCSKFWTEPKRIIHLFPSGNLTVSPPTWGVLNITEKKELLVMCRWFIHNENHILSRPSAVGTSVSSGVFYPLTGNTHYGEWGGGITWR